MVPGFRLCAATAGGTGLIPGRGARSHMLHGAEQQMDLENLNASVQKNQQQLIIQRLTQNGSQT